MQVLKEQRVLQKESETHNPGFHNKLISQLTERGKQELENQKRQAIRRYNGSNNLQGRQGTNASRSSNITYGDALAAAEDGAGEKWIEHEQGSYMNEVQHYLESHSQHIE